MCKKYAGLSFAQAIDEFSDEITKICILKLRNVEDAKDCFQNVFLKLHLSDKEWDDVRQMKAWLIRVTLNECIDFNRSYWNRNVVLGLSPETYKPFTENYECFETIELIRSLPEKYRDVIYLYYYHQYTTTEIGEILGLNVNTVKSRLQRGREKLEKIIRFKQT